MAAVIRSYRSPVTTGNRGRISPGAREEMIELLKKRLPEDKREEIVANAREALQSVRKKQAKYDGVAKSRDLEICP